MKLNYIKKPYKVLENIISFSINDDQTKKVTDFYKETPFPNYKNDDDKQSILEKGNKNLLAQKFKKFIGYKKGFRGWFGTGQLSIFFALEIIIK